MMLRKTILAPLTAMALVLLGTGGCQTISDWLDKMNGVQKNTDEPSVAATYFDVPRVKPGISLSISVTAAGVSGRQDKQYIVDAEGCISMELIGQFKCEKMTLVELKQKLEAAYKVYYLEPSVTCTFVYTAGQGMVSPWGTVTVLGEVHRPGPVDVPPTMDLTVLKALQLAGGFTSVADKRRVLVTRCEKDGSQKKTRVDVIEIGEQGRPEKDMKLRGGDVMWIPLSWY